MDLTWAAILDIKFLPFCRFLVTFAFILTSVYINLCKCDTNLADFDKKKRPFLTKCLRVTTLVVQLWIGDCPWNLQSFTPTSPSESAEIEVKPWFPLDRNDLAIVPIKDLCPAARGSKSTLGPTPRNDAAWMLVEKLAKGGSRLLFGNPGGGGTLWVTGQGSRAGHKKKRLWWGGQPTQRAGCNTNSRKTPHKIN